MPYQKWTGHKPDVSVLQEASCPVWIISEDPQKSKLQAKLSSNIFVGYNNALNAVIYYNATHCTLKVSCNYHFPCTRSAAMGPLFEGELGASDKQKSEPTCKQKDFAEPAEQTQNIYRKTTNGDEDLPDLAKGPDYDNDEVEMMSAEWIYMTFNETGLGGRDPQTLKEAKTPCKWLAWEKAIQVELEQLRQMGTWELVDPPEDRKPITNKWVFIRKYDKNGTLQKYKVRLVT